MRAGGQKWWKFSLGKISDYTVVNTISLTYLDTVLQLFFSLWTVVLCSPLTIDFRDEKFFTARQLWAMSIQWLMTLPRPSAATPPRMVAMTTSETLLKCSMQERIVGALSMSFGRWTYSRHWWSTTLRNRSYNMCECVCVHANIIDSTGYMLLVICWKKDPMYVSGEKKI